MSHATVRALNVPVIVEYIGKHYGVDENTALDMFYSSITAECYGDDETGLYGQSALYVFGMFLVEMNDLEEEFPYEQNNAP